MWAVPDGNPRNWSRSCHGIVLKKHDMNLDPKMKLVWEAAGPVLSAPCLLGENNPSGTNKINASSVNSPRNCEIA